MAKFKIISGLEINVSKSEILTNEPNLAEEIQEISRIVVKSHITSLGVKIGRNVNFIDKIELKVEKVIKSWNKKRLNFIEKIDVTNYIIIPKVVHLMRHIKLNKKDCDTVNKRLKKFVFGGCTRSVKTLLYIRE